MDPGEAAKAVLDLVSESILPKETKYELELAAKEDLVQAQALVNYLCANHVLGVPVVEATLYSLVALIYLAGCSEQELKRCGLQAPDVYCLQEFGRSIDSQCFDGNQLDDDEEVSGLLEDLWKAHCSRLGVQVVFTPVASRTGRDLKPLTTRHGPSKKMATRFFDLFTKISNHKHFTELPSRTEGPARWKVLGCIERERALHPHITAQLEKLKRSVISIYSKVRHDGRVWDVGDSKPDLVPLRVAEARKLLLARECNEVLDHLVFKRSCPSFLSHDMVVTDGVERARLFLLGADLRVNFHHPLTYGELCVGHTALEKQALDEFLHSRPSPIDKQLRQYTLDSFWSEEGAGVLNMRPEDYERAGVFGLNRALQVMRKIPVPVVVNTEDGPYCLGLAACRAYSILRYGNQETESRKAWLFPDGKPGEEEMLGAVAMVEC